MTESENALVRTGEGAKQHRKEKRVTSKAGVEGSKKKGRVSKRSRTTLIKKRK